MIPPFTRLGRWLLPVPFIVFGLFYLTTPGYYADQLPNYIPGGQWLIKFIGSAMIVAGISIYLGIKDRLAATCLAALLLLFMVFVHAKTAIGGGEKSQMALAMLFKDLGLIAGLLLYVELKEKR